MARSDNNQIEVESARRPRQNYYEMGLKPGDTLHFSALLDEQAEVVDEHYLRWRGETISLTALRDRLGEQLGTGRYSGPISVNGRMFDDLYLDTYGPAAASAKSPTAGETTSRRITLAEGTPAQKVYIANFGRENYAWPECLLRGTVATMNPAAVHGYWLAGDRDGYVDYCMSYGKTAVGIKPTKPVASRWFNLMTIISETSGDIWIHREKDQIWWTVSKSDPPTFEQDVDPTASDDPQVYVCHKPCEPWSNKNHTGNKLTWGSLHPRAREFLFTEGTLQQLSSDNAAYALALVAGSELSPWHSRSDWRTKVTSTKKAPGTIYNGRQKAVVRMTLTALHTAQFSNGQQALTTIKNKEVRFTQPELERYIEFLISSQEGLCALTGLRLGYDGECEDKALLCSLDRIDSNGHYEAGNLQVVCQFANRWKSDGANDEFLRLIGLVRSPS
jgi:hypothetical protein